MSILKLLSNKFITVSGKTVAVVAQQLFTFLMIYGPLFKNWEPHQGHTLRHIQNLQKKHTHTLG